VCVLFISFVLMITSVGLKFTLDPASSPVENGDTVCVAGEFSNPPWGRFIPMTVSSEKFTDGQYIANAPLEIPSVCATASDVYNFLQRPIQYKFVLKERSLWFLSKDLPTVEAESNGSFTNHFIIPWDFVSKDQKESLKPSGPIPNVSPYRASDPLYSTSTSSAGESDPLRGRIASSSDHTSSISTPHQGIQKDITGTNSADECVNPLAESTMPIKSTKDKNPTGQIVSSKQRNNPRTCPNCVIV
jgi:hypothetical protein